MTLITLCKESEIVEGQGKLAKANGQEIAVFKVGGEMFAIENACPHAGGPLSEGTVFDNCRVVCPWHGLETDLKTGVSTNYAGMSVKTFPVKLENGEVKVEL